MHTVAPPTAIEDTVSLTMTRKMAANLVNGSPRLADRMHLLLERNTDGLLNPTEQAELESLIDVAQVKQLIALAIGHPVTP